MSRLVIAILILFAVLVGLRAANSSLFQWNFANRLNTPAPATRSTGFSAESTGTGTSASSGVQQTNLNPNQAGTGTTSLPPSNTQPAVSAGW